MHSCLEALPDWLHMYKNNISLDLLFISQLLMKWIWSKKLWKHVIKQYFWKFTWDKQIQRILPIQLYFQGPMSYRLITIIIICIWKTIWPAIFNIWPICATTSRLVINNTHYCSEFKMQKIRGRPFVSFCCTGVQK